MNNVVLQIVVTLSELLSFPVFIAPLLAFEPRGYFV
jgi:hypothetical protein